MKEMRSGSQILFGHLPEQTIDAAGGIWKVRQWSDPKLESGIDIGALRDELIRVAYPWFDQQQDGGFVTDLLRQRAVKVRSLNRDRGVWCEPFPRLYKCRRCDRLHDEPMGRCQCGSTARRGQLPFVGYHDVCGAIKTPYVKKCPTHGQRAVRLPGSASSTELIFYCPVCNDVLHRGFNARCDCDAGGALSFTVHRSGTVFKPHGVVVINPPKRETLMQVERAGGGERALEWLLSGMPGRRLTDVVGAASSDSVRRMLEERGLDGPTIEAMLAAMPKTVEAAVPDGDFDPRVRQELQQEARQIALATFESRITIPDLLDRAESQSLKTRYSQSYPRALRRAGLERVEMIDKFPVLTGQFGYTRGDATPGSSRLRTYREANGEYTVYGELVETEALFVRLSPIYVHRWLRRAGVPLGNVSDPIQASVAVLEALKPPASQNPFDLDDHSRLLTTLVHSYAHAFIRRASVFAGIDRNALSELVVPHAFGFFVYAAARGDFVLGGLQALFEADLDSLVNEVVDDEHRCALDPGCHDTGAACAVCLHLGEPSCRLFNTMLSRTTLAGGDGYFDIIDPT